MTPLVSQEIVKRTVTAGYVGRKKVTKTVHVCVIQIAAPGRRLFMAEIPVCDCGRPVCGSDHFAWSQATHTYVRQQATVDACERRGKCHPYRNGRHKFDIDGFIAKLLRTYGRGVRVHTPSLPPANGRGFTPTGKPEAIAVPWGDYGRHPADMSTDEVREQIALAWADAA